MTNDSVGIEVFEKFPVCKDFFEHFAFFGLEIFREFFERFSQEKIFYGRNVFSILAALSGVDFLLFVLRIAAESETIADLGVQAEPEMRLRARAIRKISPKHPKNKFQGSAFSERADKIRT